MENGGQEPFICSAGSSAGRSAAETGVRSRSFVPPDPRGDPRGGPRDGSPRAELASALRLLPAEQRETLLMRLIDDMTLQEIADALNIPLGTAQSCLHHALKTLREHKLTRTYFDEV